MINVKFFGVLRLDRKIKTTEIDSAKNVNELYKKIFEKHGIPVKELAGCNVFVNGKLSNPHTKLSDGDEIMLMSPVAGG